MFCFDGESEICFPRCQALLGYVWCKIILQQFQVSNVRYLLKICICFRLKFEQNFDVPWTNEALIIVEKFAKNRLTNVPWCSLYYRMRNSIWKLFCELEMRRIFCYSCHFSLGQIEWEYHFVVTNLFHLKRKNEKRKL